MRYFKAIYTIYVMPEGEGFELTTYTSNESDKCTVKHIEEATRKAIAMRENEGVHLQSLHVTEISEFEFMKYQLKENRAKYKLKMNG
ncbi:hypothetical protein DXT76_01125 [Halobacillus trueperi]|uniref:Uncharacterized protein n=1 Tax=Halobacillus trueperi TaxID=156205 RepID=A0A3D8VT33_9BACI|nr:hypothetical protein [Halobacillus trueperi]RDY72572.1 hypothetical protein DXT76_01125 [Halobacillus trueperi]